MIRRRALLVLAFAAVTGCTAMPAHDYTAFRATMPDSILVLPPLNHTTDVNAPYTFLSTVTRPLVEAGYYVFPVAVVDAFLKENGLPTPYEMHGVPLDKVRDILGADAVLYVVISEWGQKYQILSSNTVVEWQARLVDVETGQELWRGLGSAVEGSGGQGDGLLGMAVAAVIDQVLDSLVDRTYDLSRQATRQMIFNSSDGLLYGPRHRDYETDQRGR